MVSANVTSANPQESSVKTIGTSARTNLFWKRLMDLSIASFVTMFILLWLIPLVGWLIALESKGPILFIQTRNGLGGRRFGCFKFRTMTYDRDAVFKQAIKNDPRVTRIGRFLRRTNLDEMPQFLNVLLGDMSLVGPRPHAVQHDEEFANLLPNYMNRYAVLPGITGLAQVRGTRGLIIHNKKMQDRLRYDLFYIEKCSVWYDLKICWWTLETMLKGDANAW